MKRLAILLAAAAVGGCTVGPDYAPPTPEVPAAFAGAPPTPEVPAAFAGAPPAPGATAPDLARWWRRFDDPELDRLVAIALADNLDALSAASRVRAARAEVRVQRAQGLPSIDATGDASHIQFSKNAGLSSLGDYFGGGAAGGTGGGGQNSIAAPGDGITTYAIGFDASWELDVFGGVRRGVEAASARAEAAQWDERDAAVSLAAEVADNYLQLRLLQQREAIARAEVARQSRSLQLMIDRFRVGLVPQGDSVRQRAQLAFAQAALPALAAEQAARLHAIAMLLAKPPETFRAELTGPAPDVTAPVVPPGLPSDLLRRRPDIRAAERDLAASTADIGVATAALYPRFSLTGAAQLISTALGSLFSGDSVQTTAMAALDFPILDFGGRRALVTERREAAQQAYLTYQKTVLGALRDVEDALVRVTDESQRVATLASGTRDAERAVAAVQAQYATGLVGLDSVLNAQATVLNDRDQLAQSRGQLRRDIVSLYKAIGGGWDESDPKSAAGGSSPTSSAPSATAPSAVPRR